MVSNGYVLIRRPPASRTSRPPPEAPAPATMGRHPLFPPYVNGAAPNPCRVLPQPSPLPAPRNPGGPAVFRRLPRGRTDATGCVQLKRCAGWWRSTRCSTAPSFFPMTVHAGPGRSAVPPPQGARPPLQPITMRVVSAPAWSSTKDAGVPSSGSRSSSGTRWAGDRSRTFVAGKMPLERGWPLSTTLPPAPRPPVGIRCLVPRTRFFFYPVTRSTFSRASPSHFVGLHSVGGPP